MIMPPLAYASGYLRNGAPRRTNPIRTLNPKARTEAICDVTSNPIRDSGFRPRVSWSVKGLKSAERTQSGRSPGPNEPNSVRYSESAERTQLSGRTKNTKRTHANGGSKISSTNPKRKRGNALHDNAAARLRFGLPQKRTAAPNEPNAADRLFNPEPPRTVLIRLLESRLRRWLRVKQGCRWVAQIRRGRMSHSVSPAV